MSEENKLFVQLVKKTGSQANFCMLTSMDKSICSRYYNGKDVPKSATVDKYANMLGFKVTRKLEKIIS